MASGRTTSWSCESSARSGSPHISLRYLHRLFEDADEGVAGLIRQRRLDHCRSDLLDPVLAGRPVAATAVRWEFSSPAHFEARR
jgi:AraC-like DNA-binding protein